MRRRSVITRNRSRTEEFHPRGAPARSRRLGSHGRKCRLRHPRCCLAGLDYVSISFERALLSRKGIRWSRLHWDRNSQCLYNMVSVGLVYAVLDDICYDTHARSCSIGMPKREEGSPQVFASLTTTWPESSDCLVSVIRIEEYLCIHADFTIPATQNLPTSAVSRSQVGTTHISEWLNSAQHHSFIAMIHPSIPIPKSPMLIWGVSQPNRVQHVVEPSML